MAVQGVNVAGLPLGGGAAAPPAGPAGPTSRIWPPDTKELITSVIALVIVTITSIMILWSYFHSASPPPPAEKGGTSPTFDNEGFNRAKDILSFALGLFGTVTGYYFGRVPAEKQADAARHSADVAKQSQAIAENRTQLLRSDVKNRIQGIINSTVPDPQAVLTAAGPAFQQSHAGITSRLTSLLAEL